MKVNQNIYFFNTLAIIAVLFVFCTCNNELINKKSPEALYGRLFYDVQSNENIFEDSKTFVDCEPKYEVEIILKKYTELEDKSDTGIKRFLKENFILPETEINFVTDSVAVNEHITKLWEVLKRPSDKKSRGTLISLPYPYIVPGGRFREIYYWDSYFTMLGLSADGEVESIRNMLDNFAYLIDNYGFIPNGNRTYYLSRSQPPFFTSMVGILASLEGKTTYETYLQNIIKEYEFWMNGSENLNNNTNTYRRVVLLPDGEVLNRYWDDNDTPRPESYREDIKTANEAAKKNPKITHPQVYRDLRAAAESGWDFSSRWFSNDSCQNMHLSDIHTTDIIPVDLNSLLCDIEMTISKTYRQKGNIEKAEEFRKKAETRKKAILKYCWSHEKQFFMDYNFDRNKQTDIYSLAGIYPLFLKIAENYQAELVAGKVEKLFLEPGGVVTTLYDTNEQWDAPNGWAPMQWITISGLRNYQQNRLANEIKKRWLQNNERVYKNTLKMTEKYNVLDISVSGGGGEYPNQDGFGWTNGVFQKLSKENYNE